MRSRRRNAPNVTTSGSRRAASGETISPAALRAPSATLSPEEPDNPSKEDFNNEVMCMSYLYSKLPETGVSPHIDTGGCGSNRTKPPLALGILLVGQDNNGSVKQAFNLSDRDSVVLALLAVAGIPIKTRKIHVWPPRK